MIDGCQAEKGEAGNENRFQNRPISGRRDLPHFRLEWLPAFHSASPTEGRRGLKGSLLDAYSIRPSRHALEKGEARIEEIGKRYFFLRF
jgi:hypothetical protein